MAGPRLIGVTGRARSGKDTVTQFVIAHTGGYQYSFAEPLRRMLLGLGIDMHDPYWIARKEQVIPALGASPRKMMQTLGTEWGRGLINKDLWLIMAKQYLLSNGPGMVISDVRFENEADWVRKNGGLLIHVTRDDAPEVSAHVSEAGVVFVEGTDVLIENNDSLESLQAKVQAVLDGVFKT